LQEREKVLEKSKLKPSRLGGGKRRILLSDWCRKREKEARRPCQSATKPARVRKTRRKRGLKIAGKKCAAREFVRQKTRRDSTHKDTRNDYNMPCQEEGHQW